MSLAIVPEADEEGRDVADQADRPEGDRRRGPATWVPYVAVCISLVSMLLGPCFGAGVAVIGNYVAKQQDAAVAAEQRRQSDEKLTVIGNQVAKLVEQGNARIATDTEVKIDIGHLKEEQARDRRDIDENAKIMNAYGAKIQGKGGK